MTRKIYVKPGEVVEVHSLAPPIEVKTVEWTETRVLETGDEVADLDLRSTADPIFALAPDAEDVELRNLRVVGDHATLLRARGPVNGLALYGVHGQNLEHGVILDPNLLAYRHARSRSHDLYRAVLLDSVELHTTSTAIYAAVDGLTIDGCKFVAGRTSHCVRFPLLVDSKISNVTLGGAGSGKHLLKLHSIPNHWGLRTDAVFLEHVLLESDLDAWAAQVGPQNAHADEALGQVTFRECTHVRSASSRAGIHVRNVEKFDAYTAKSTMLYVQGVEPPHDYRDVIFA